MCVLDFYVFSHVSANLGVIQQLRGPNFAIFLPPPYSFYTLSVDKNRHFLTPSYDLILSA